MGGLLICDGCGKEKDIENIGGDEWVEVRWYTTLNSEKLFLKRDVLDICGKCIKKIYLSHTRGF